jgi:hypothetical protein
MRFRREWFRTRGQGDKERIEGIEGIEGIDGIEGIEGIDGIEIIKWNMETWNITGELT